jgi:hypothetical protein
MSGTPLIICTAMSEASSIIYPEVKPSKNGTQDLTVRAWGKTFTFEWSGAMFLYHEGRLNLEGTGGFCQEYLFS